MTTFVFLKTLLLLLAIIKTSLECKQSSSGKSDTDDDGTSVDPTASPPKREYNCTDSETDGNTTRWVVSNLSDADNIQCETVLTILDLSREEANGDDEIRLCNYLGDTVCPNCTADSSYRTNISPSNANGATINISCFQEQTTTPPPPPTTTVPEEETTSEAQVSNFTDESRPTGGQTQISVQEILIYVGAGLVVLLLVIITVVCVKKRRSSDSALKNSKNSGGSEEVLRVETNETGELYTVVNKQGPEKVVYNAVADDVEITENENNGDMYSVVNKNGTQNGGMEQDTALYNVLYKENGVKSGAENGGHETGLYDTLNRGDKSAEDTAGATADESTYNSLYQPKDPNKNEVYSVVSPHV